MPQHLLHHQSRRRWLVLLMGMLAQAAASVFQLGLPYLLPELRELTGGSLTQASVLVACPTIGLLLTLVLWGAVADHVGERVPMATGLIAAGLLLFMPLIFDGPVVLGIVLALAGATAAAVNASSGRVILGWFPTHERGLAMGIRQTAQPLGTAVAAVTLSTIAIAVGRNADDAGVAVALVFPAALCVVVGVLVLLLVQDPPRTPRVAGEETVNPYRSPALWRLHASSALLVVPQYAVLAFSYLYLVDVCHWSNSRAAIALGVVQLTGALSRLVVGHWSDRWGSRLRPMRVVVLADIIVVALFAATTDVTAVAIPVLLIAGVVTVSPNGLAFTASAEMAGPRWAGRALGVQNTGQMFTGAIAPIALGAAIAAHGYGPTFAVVTLLPLLALFLIPVRAELRSNPNEL